MSNLSQAQDDAFTRVTEILREHFDAAVLVVSTEHVDENKKDVVECVFHGGYAASVGLCVLAEELIREEYTKTTET